MARVIHTQLSGMRTSKYLAGFFGAGNDKFRALAIFGDPDWPESEIISPDFAPYRNRTRRPWWIYLFIVPHLVGSAQR